MNFRARYVRPHAQTVLAASAADTYQARSRQANRLFLGTGGPYEDASGPLHRGAQMGWGWNGFFLDADNDGDEDLWSPMGSDPSRCRPRRGRGCRSPSRSCQPPSERPTCGRRC